MRYTQRKKKVKKLETIEFETLLPESEGLYVAHLVNRSRESAAMLTEHFQEVVSDSHITQAQVLEWLEEYVHDPGNLDPSRDGCGTVLSVEKHPAEPWMVARYQRWKAGKTQ